MKSKITKKIGRGTDEKMKLLIKEILDAKTREDIARAFIHINTYGFTDQTEITSKQAYEILYDIAIEKYRNEIISKEDLNKIKLNFQDLNRDKLSYSFDDLKYEKKPNNPSSPKKHLKGHQVVKASDGQSTNKKEKKNKKEEKDEDMQTNPSDEGEQDLEGFEGQGKIKNNYALHAILINKNIPLEEARKIAQEYIKDKKKKYYRETKNQYRFRNISKQKFNPKSFKSKKINKYITLVFGELKEDKRHLIGGDHALDNFITIINYINRNNPIKVPQPLYPRMLKNGSDYDKISSYLLSFKPEELQRLNSEINTIMQKNYHFPAQINQFVIDLLLNFKSPFNPYDLRGNGIMDFIKDPIGHIKEAFAGIPTKYNNVSRRTLEQYGNEQVSTLRIARTELNKGLTFLINSISLGKWNELVKKNGFDKLYHLSLIVNEKIIIEKNESITIEPLSQSKSIKPSTEFLNVNVDKQITINEMMDNTRLYMGDDNFFDYEALTNNCQYFIASILDANGLYGDTERKFLMQDFTQFSKDLNNSGYSYVPKIMRKITDLGSIVSRLSGKGTKKKALKEFDNYIKKYNINENDLNNITEHFIDFINREGLKFL